MRTKTTRAWQERGYTYDCVKLFQLHKAEPIKGEGDLLENKGWYNETSGLIEWMRYVPSDKDYLRKGRDYNVCEPEVSYGSKRASDLLDGAKEMARITQHMRKKTDPDYRAGRLEVSDWMLAEPDPVVQALLEMGYVHVEQAHAVGQGYRFYKEAA